MSAGQPEFFVLDVCNRTEGQRIKFIEWLVGSYAFWKIWICQNGLPRAMEWIPPPSPSPARHVEP
ncbi:hypothetical protein EMIT0P395_20389 [Pseudomonas sp. IT-P395]